MQEEYTTYFRNCVHSGINCGIILVAVENTINGVHRIIIKGIIMNKYTIKLSDGTEERVEADKMVINDNAVILSRSPETGKNSDYKAPPAETVAMFPLNSVLGAFKDGTVTRFAKVGKSEVEVEVDPTTGLVTIPLTISLGENTYYQPVKYTPEEYATVTPQRIGKDVTNQFRAAIEAAFKAGGGVITQPSE